MDKEELGKLKQHYKLLETENDRILQKLLEQSFVGRKPVEKPILKYVLAQTGAGKSTLIMHLLDCYSNFVFINSDDYRSLRSDAEEILSKYPLEYVALTNEDAHRQGDMLLEEAVRRNYNVLREKAPREDFLASLPKLPNYYKIEFDVLAVGDLNSLLSTRERYEKELALGIKTAKLSSLENHNKIYETVVKIVASKECEDIEIRIFVRGGTGETFIQVYPGGDFKTAFEALTYYRQLDNLGTIKTFETRFDNLKLQMKQRNASREQFEQLNEIFRLYQKYKDLFE